MMTSVNCVQGVHKELLGTSMEYGTPPRELQNQPKEELHAWKLVIY